MTTKSLKKFTELLNRSEGLSIIPIIAIMVLMSVMGVVFTSIMGNWKISAPITINSNKAYNLAETAAMFALQDAKYRFFSKNASGTPIFPSTSPIGERSSPFQVINTSTETAEFWIERPYLIGSPPFSTNYTVDLGRGNNDDIITGADDEDEEDDDSDDDTVNGTTDVDGDGFSDVYTIIATGKVKRGGATVATRQIKIKAVITDNSAIAIAPGVHTDGSIIGSGNNIGNCFGIRDETLTDRVGYETGTWAFATEDPSDPLDSDYVAADETGLIFRSAPTLDKGAFKAMAIDQGHYHNADLEVKVANDGYPNSSYYYDPLTIPIPTMPNIIYLEGSTTDLKINANRTGYGIYYVEGNVDLAGNGSTINGIVICEGDITLGGTSFITGGLIHYGGVINGNGNPAAITLDSGYFDFLNATITNINVQSWQEAVSAN